MRAGIQHKIDTGVIKLWTEDDQLAFDAKQRERARPLRAARRLRDANLPDRHAARTEFRNDAWLALVLQLQAEIPVGFIFALLGPRGTGKTQLAERVIRHAISACDISARYEKASTLYRTVRLALSSDEGEGDEVVFRQYLDYGLLVIDELHVVAGTEFEQRTLTELIDRRYDAQRSTLLIANLNRDEFAAAVGPSIVSRIHECGEAVETNWPSFRIRREDR